MEAITIFLAYNFCMGVLSSVVILTMNPTESIPEAAIDSKSICITAEVAESIFNEAIEAESEEEESTEALVCESIAPDETDFCEYESISCFSEGFDSSFKAYMDYRCITDTSSVQYSLQQQAYTDERGFRRIGDDYCVALGTGITNGCGERFMITLDSGYSFSAVVSDIKADIHTDSTNCYATRGENAGNIVEFIIDSNSADEYMLSCGSAGCFEDLSGNIISIIPL